MEKTRFIFNEEVTYGDLLQYLAQYHDVPECNIACELTKEQRNDPEQTLLSCIKEDGNLREFLADVYELYPILDERPKINEIGLLFRVVQWNDGTIRVTLERSRYIIQDLNLNDSPYYYVTKNYCAYYLSMIVEVWDDGELLTGFKKVELSRKTRLIELATILKEIEKIFIEEGVNV